LLHIYEINLKHMYTDNHIKKLIEAQKLEGYTKD